MKAVLLLILAVALSLLAVGTVRAGTTYRVGSDCPYATIQAAIDAIPDQGTGIIRIRNGTYVENLEINNKTVELLGGHSDCTTTDTTTVTTIDASGSASPVITYRVNLGPAGTSHELFADKLSLSGGTGSGTAYGGGLSVFTTADHNALVTLSRTFVRNNQTTHVGGGIALRGEGSGTLALLENTQIENNTVTGTDPYGGGLYCEGDYNVTMLGGSIRRNIAGEPGHTNARGGGIYLDGCDMTWFAQNQTSSTDEASLRTNTVYGGGATGDGFGGGGLYAKGGAQVDLIGAHFTLFGDPASSRPLRIHNNLARATNGDGFDIGSGSAVYASGSGTRVRLDRTWVYANDANSRAALYARGGAEIIVERGSEVCHTPRNCSRVFDNSADLTAVAFSHTDSAIRFRRTIVSNNTGAYLFAGQSGGDIDLQDSLIFDNSTSAGFEFLQNGDSMLNLVRSTVASNGFSGNIFTIQPPGTGTTVVRVYDSIIHEPGTTMAVGTSDPTLDIAVDCVVWHDDQLAVFEVSGNRTQVADPMFVDPAADLFYLQPGSPAINYCSVAPPAPGVDIDWNPRGISHSDQPDVYGPYDLGAYEFPLGIFEDRFEQP